MQIIKTVKEMQAFAMAARCRGKIVGFVPTMGALHAGHAALLKRCRRENDLCVLSIFVNPAQFSPDEDFAAYPRNKKEDVLLAKKEKVDIMFYPSAEEIYQPGYLTYIDVNKITSVLCGRSRPGHFRGVTTVVGKLLNIIGPHVLYLGQKDAQQCAVIKQMVRDLNFPLKVTVVPTVREKDGLALSSRNMYLTQRQRREAAVIYQSLQLAKRQVRQGQRSAKGVIRMIKKNISKKTSGRIDYIECADAATLEPKNLIAGRTLVALAVRFGRARLIDNIII